MKVNVYPADRGGCGWNRIIWPAEALKAQGADVDIIFSSDPDWRQINTTGWLNDDGSRIVFDVPPPDCDVVVLQRPLTDTLNQAIPFLQRAGIKVVVDIDDDFTAISARNISFRSVHPSRSPRRNWQLLADSCAKADLVVVSTPALADVYGRHGRAVVVRNRVPERYLWTPRVSHEGPPAIGWSGSIETHPDDLQVMGSAIGKLCNRGDATFRVVGTGRGVRKLLGLNEPPLACGWKPIDEYPSFLADLDVGVVPLKLDRFNEAKSALKLMEMSALGTPAVVSPTSENVRMAQLVGAELAATPKDWAGKLRRLVVDPVERAERGERARAAMAGETYEAHCGEWWDAWTSAVNTPCAA